MLHSRGFAFAAVILACTCAGISLRGQTGALNGEWRAYGGDPGHTRYAPLDQIDATNFGKLTVAWRFKTDHLGPRPEFMFESTPVMANGVLYSTAGSRRAVVALDPETGEELWMHSEREGPRGAAGPRQLSGRGLAYWTDGKEERILYVTPGYRLVALNAKTGMRIPSFGDDGIVDLKQNNDQQIDPMSGEIGLHATPTVAGNVVVVGAAHRSGGVPTGKTNVKGYIRGFDVRTGKRLWIFHTIPQPGEFGNDTWLKDSWAYTGNTGAWGQISVDAELQIAYLPVESATGDYFGADRPGNNLFAESLVAVDLQTGKRKWHYQLVHHGIWDHDIPCAPILVDIRRDGKIIKAVAQPTKQAFMYVFDRVTGQPLWPIEERPVPKGDAINIFRYFAGEGSRQFTYQVPSERENVICYTIRKPLGTVALITPWNFPAQFPHGNSRPRSWQVIPLCLSQPRSHHLAHTDSLKPCTKRAFRAACSITSPAVAAPLAIRSQAIQQSKQCRLPAPHRLAMRSIKKSRKEKSASSWRWAAEPNDRSQRRRSGLRCGHAHQRRVLFYRPKVHCVQPRRNRALDLRTLG